MFAILLTVLFLRFNEPGPVTLESLPISPEALAAMDRIEMKVAFEGKTTTYSGVALASILAKREKPVAGMPGLRDLADSVLLVRGADGYQAAVSAAAVAMDPEGKRYLFATSREGESRSPQMIIPGDDKRARWVRDIVAVRLVRLNHVVKADP